MKKFREGPLKTPKINNNFDDCGEKVGKSGGKYANFGRKISKKARLKARRAGPGLQNFEKRPAGPKSKARPVSKSPPGPNFTKSPARVREIQARYRAGPGRAGPGLKSHLCYVHCSLAKNVLKFIYANFNPDFQNKHEKLVRMIAYVKSVISTLYF